MGSQDSGYLWKGRIVTLGAGPKGDIRDADNDLLIVLHTYDFA